MKCGKTRNDCFWDKYSRKHLKFKKDHAEEFSETNGIEIQSQHWGVNRQLSMEVIAVECFPTSVDPGSNE